MVSIRFGIKDIGENTDEHRCQERAHAVTQETEADPLRLAALEISQIAAVGDDLLDQMVESPDHLHGIEHSKRAGAFTVAEVSDHTQQHQCDSDPQAQLADGCEPTAGKESEQAAKREQLPQAHRHCTDPAQGASGADPLGRPGVVHKQHVIIWW